MALGTSCSSARGRKVLGALKALVLHFSRYPFSYLIPSHFQSPCEAPVSHLTILHQLAREWSYELSERAILLLCIYSFNQ